MVVCQTGLPVNTNMEASCDSIERVSKVTLTLHHDSVLPSAVVLLMPHHHKAGVFRLTAVNVYGNIVQVLVKLGDSNASVGYF